MSPVTISPVDLLTHSSEQAEHVQFYSCPGISAHGFHVSPGGSSTSPSKGRPLGAVVLLVPVVHAVSGESHRHLVAFVQDDEAFVASELRAIRSDRGLHALAGSEAHGPTFGANVTLPLTQLMSTSCGPSGIGMP